jgi:hypothetical protein
MDPAESLVQQAIRRGKEAPAEGMEWLASLAEEEAIAAAQAFGAALAAQAPREAAEAARAVAASHVREAMLAGVFTAWAGQDLDEPGHYLNAAAGAGDLDAARSAYAAAIHAADPEAARAWYDTILTQNHRIRIESLFQSQFTSTTQP